MGSKEFRSRSVVPSVRWFHLIWWWLSWCWSLQVADYCYSLSHTVINNFSRLYINEVSVCLVLVAVSVETLSEQWLRWCVVEAQGACVCESFRLQRWWGNWAAWPEWLSVAENRRQRPERRGWRGRRGCTAGSTHANLRKLARTRCFSHNPWSHGLLNDWSHWTHSPRHDEQRQVLIFFLL